MKILFSNTAWDSVYQILQRHRGQKAKRQNQGPASREMTILRTLTTYHWEEPRILEQMINSGQEIYNMSLEYSVMTESKEALKRYKDTTKWIRSQSEESSFYPSGQRSISVKIIIGVEFKYIKYDTYIYIYVCVCVCVCVCVLNVCVLTMATHSSVLAWRIPGMGEPGGLPSMGSHRVRHDWSDLAAAAAAHNSSKKSSQYK